QKLANRQLPPQLAIPRARQASTKLAARIRHQSAVTTLQNLLELQRPVGTAIASQAKLPLSSRPARDRRSAGLRGVQDPTKAEGIRPSPDGQAQSEITSRPTQPPADARAERAKKIRKLTEDTKTGVFLVKDLSDLSHRFKVRANAEQLGMTGRGR
uniref:Ribosomal_L7Ae domain-containing protein n=1 Tax=Macrostomum lignano TaxID=282301 RepID=A0A1I8FRA3_9PLAT